MQNHVVGGNVIYDNRLPFYFSGNVNSGIIVGSPIDNTTDTVSYWGSYLVGPITSTYGSPSWPTPLVTYFEALFIKAEVEARQGNMAAAVTDLNAAVNESFKKVTGAADTTIAGKYTAANTNLSRIMFEKWIAMYGQVEAYNDYRRTGFPKLTPNPNGAIAVIPKRYPTPDQESNYNPNAVIQNIANPVWWAQ
jgi:hypothetical protein